MKNRSPFRRPETTFVFVAVLGLSVLGSACASDDGSGKKDEDAAIEMEKPGVTRSREGEYLVEYYDVDGDENPDVIKYIDEETDPENPDVVERTLRKKKVDVNGDGDIDIVKFYGKTGIPEKEKLDTDLDGTDDVISYFKNGRLARKELLADNGKDVETTRFYEGDEMVRVERDTNGDGKVDYWEYYDEGKLQRIGKDENGDTKIDKWVYRD